MNYKTRIFIAVTVALAGVFVTDRTVRGLRWDTSLENLFPDGSIGRQRYSDFHNSFGTDDVMLLVIKDRAEQPVFNEETLRYLDSAVAALEAEPIVDSVVSISNLNAVNVAEFFGKLVPLPPQPLVPRPRDKLDPEVVAELQENPLLLHGLLSADHRSTAAWIVLNPELRASPTYFEEVERLEALIPTPHPDARFEVIVTGFPLVQATVLELLWNDGVRLLLAAVLVVAVGATLGGVPMRTSLAFLFAWPPITAVLALWCYFADRPLHVFSNNLLPLLLITSGATLVHLGRAFGREGRAGESVKSTFRACLLATVTTATGFGTLALSPLPPLAWLGVEAAAGSFLALFFTAGFLWWMCRDRIDHAGPTWSGPGSSGKPLSKVLFAALLVLAMPLFLTSPSRIGLAGDFLEYLPTDHQRVQDVVRAQDALGAQTAFEIVVKLDPEESRDKLEDPAFYLSLAEFERELQLKAGAEIPFIVSPVTLISYLNTRIAATRGEDVKQAFEVTKDSAELAIQWLIKPYLNLGEAKKAGVETEQHLLTTLRDTLRQLLSEDGQKVRFGCRIPYLSPEAILTLSQDLEQNVYPRFAAELGAEIYTTGYGMLIAESAVEVRNTQIRSLLGGGAALALILLLVLRSAPLWFIAVSTNTLTISAVITLLWIFEAKLNLYTTVLTATLLGILVDNSIHFLLCYRRHQSAGEHAVRNALLEVGPSITLSSMCLSGGFGLFLLSELPVYQQFAWTAIGGVFLALYWDLLILSRWVQRHFHPTPVPTEEG